MRFYFSMDTFIKIFFSKYQKFESPLPTHIFQISLDNFSKTSKKKKRLPCNEYRNTTLVENKSTENFVRARLHVLLRYSERRNVLDTGSSRKTTDNCNDKTSLGRRGLKKTRATREYTNGSRFDRKKKDKNVEKAKKGKEKKRWSSDDRSSELVAR